MPYLDKEGLTHLWGKVKAALSGKQDILTGTEGQVVGFNAEGRAVAQEAPGGGLTETDADERYMGKFGAEFNLDEEVDIIFYDKENGGGEPESGAVFSLTGESITTIFNQSEDRYSVVSFGDSFLQIAMTSNDNPVPSQIALAMSDSMLQYYIIENSAEETKMVSIIVDSDGVDISKIVEPTTDEMPATKRYVDNAVSAVSGVPAGAVVMWNGTAANIPNGWALCDGQNGTPNISGPSASVSCIIKL